MRSHFVVHFCLGAVQLVLDRLGNCVSQRRSRQKPSVRHRMVIWAERNEILQYVFAAVRLPDNVMNMNSNVERAKATSVSIAGSNLVLDRNESVCIPCCQGSAQLSRLRYSSALIRTIVRLFTRPSLSAYRAAYRTGVGGWGRVSGVVHSRLFASVCIAAERVAKLAGCSEAADTKVRHHHVRFSTVDALERCRRLATSASVMSRNESLSRVLIVGDFTAATAFTKCHLDL